MDGEPRRGKSLREGFSRGSCAAAAAKAATIALVTHAPQTEATIDLPIGRRVTFAVNGCQLEDNLARCSVIKDAGDDPDCTHGAEIFAEGRLKAGPGISIHGADALSRVTKPALSLPIRNA